MKKFIFMWKQQHTLYHTPYRIGGNSKIYLLKNNKSLICKKSSSNRVLRDIGGLYLSQQYYKDVSPILKEVYYDSTKNEYYYFMERYTDDLLDVIINKYTRLTFNDCLTISYKLTDKLNKIHSSYIAHRDLKPENIFLNETKNNTYDFNSLRIGDFDSCCNSQYPDILTSYGTEKYDPPEKKNNLIYNYIAGDIYSLGLIKCILLTNGTFDVYFFRKPIKSSLLYHIIMNEDDRYENYKVIKEYCKLINKMLNHDPLKRPSLQYMLQFYNRIKNI